MQLIAAQLRDIASVDNVKLLGAGGAVIQDEDLDSLRLEVGLSAVPSA